MVITRVGYAGGTTQAPTYKQMGDHTETLQIEFNPKVISFRNLLKVFWENHNPNRALYKERQYISIILYQNEEQRVLIEKMKSELEYELKEEIQTEVSPCKHFTLAEDYHQKYYLKKYPDAVEKMRTIYPTDDEYFSSTLVARLNGFVKGYGTLTNIKEEIRSWNTSQVNQTKLIDLINSIKW
ncbi:peptide-methionine (S)-S-oxide reductase [Litchfieldia salsa]|uniref:peptide-methionine (S)-S-oxide reductase n=1 Tax=Litchfieldia salsa TaxID=930152 RepID=A0A1H0RU13_9BACI|nr:peptide-methionine (S)-S-oxide reductase [Litchfieldia salsa]